MEHILEQITKSVVQLLQPLNPLETYTTIVKEAIKLVNGDEGRILLEEKGKFKLVYASAESIKYPENVRPKGYVYTAFTKRQAFYIGEQEIAEVYPLIRERGIKSAIFIPLYYKHKSTGVLVLQSLNPYHFSQRELKTLKLFGSMASLAIEHAKLHGELQKSLETRDLFISLVAHELRTPLTTINGYIGLLYSYFQGADSQEAKWVEELSWETVRLTNLVSELLTVNRIKAGVLDYVWKEVSLREVIKRARLDFIFNHPGRELIFQDKLIGKDDVVVGDHDKLLQVFTNILDNAAKFSPKKCAIVLQLSCKVPYLVIKIKDQGKGIPKDLLPRVFEGFYKGKDNYKEGMGLGLFLAKHIIAQHQGTINVQSRENKGTTFEIQLRRVKI